MTPPTLRAPAAYLVALAALTGCFSTREPGGRSASPPVPDGGGPLDDAEAALVDARPYNLYMPPAVDTPALVMMLAGYSVTGPVEETYLQIMPTATSQKFLYADPSATIDCPNEPGWNATNACCRFCMTPAADPVDDVAYLTAVLDDIAFKSHSDPKRVFLVGHSNGGFMSHRMACDRASRIAAIVSYAGAQWDDPSQCNPSEPVSVVEIHGDQDTSANYGIAYDGGSTSEGPYPSAPETVKIWAEKDGCTGTLVDTGKRLDLVANSIVPGSETVVQAYTGCPAGIDVELWTMKGAGHMDTLNPTNFGNAIWAFMSAHPKQ